LAVLGRVFVRVSMAGAERHFHLTALPTPVPVVVAEPSALVAPLSPLPASPQEQIPT